MKVTHTTRPLIVRIGTATGHGAPRSADEIGSSGVWDPQASLK